MKNILVLAYQLSPTKGSEYSVAWNYVIRMSKYNKLTVIYGTSGNHLGDCSEMKEFVKNSNLPNIKFINVKPNKWTEILNWCNRHNFFNYSFYFAYNAWQKQVYHKVKKLIKDEHFDLIHFVGPIGYREPGYLWKLNLPYIWGPIGGTNNASMILLKNAPLSAKFKFKFRNIINQIQLRLFYRVRKAIEATDLLLTATTENQKTIKTFFNKESLYLPENSISHNIHLNTDKFINCTKFHLIIIGSINAGKAVNIALEAISKIKNKNKIVIDIVGDGAMTPNLKKYANENKIDDIINWHGQLSREKAINLFNQAHLHIVTSAKEGNPTTIWEAMSHGVPSISFDHCGMHDTICKHCGIKIPISNYEQCVIDLANEIDFLIEHPKRLEELANGVLKCAQKYTWEKREEILLECYDIAINNYNNKKFAHKK